MSSDPAPPARATGLVDDDLGARRGERPTRSADDPTLTLQVYERVRLRILNGDLLPGQPMSRRTIANDMHISLLPVAQALQRLELEGLIESRPRSGTRVRTLSRDELLGHFVVREALETSAAMRAARSATAFELQHLETLAREVDRLTAGRCELALYLAAHREFHQQLAACGRCAALSQAIDQCHAFTTLWLTRTAWWLGPHTMHQELVTAISSRDAEQAAQAVRQHLSVATTRALEAYPAGSPSGARTARFRHRRRMPSTPSARRPAQQ